MLGLPAMAQWATFLRNHDELDLCRLTDEQRADVWRSFAPRAECGSTGGVSAAASHRCCGATCGGSELAYALQFSLPGTPGAPLRRGDRHGLRTCRCLIVRRMRTPMQWEDYPHAGFSTASKSADLVRPTKRTGRYGWRTVNVRQQESDPSSLLRWFEHLTRTLRECPEIGVGTFTVIEVPHPGVLVHRFDAPEGSMLMIHNLDDKPVEVDIGPLAGSDRPFDVLADSQYDRPSQRLRGLRLRGFGYRWVRLNRSNAV